MLRLLLVALLSSVILASETAEVGGEVVNTYISYLDRPTKASYFVNKSPLTTTIAGELYMSRYNFVLDVKVSNRLPESPVERLSVQYNDRKGSHIINTEVGTVETYRGIFHTTRSSKDQSPAIFKNSGVYNDEFLTGFLETTFGIRQTYSYLFSNRYLLSVSYLYSTIRELDKTKSEQSIFGYESGYVDLSHDYKIKSWEIELNLQNSFYLFYHESDILFNVVDANPISAEKFDIYLSEGDSSILASTNTPYIIDFKRVGGSYTHRNFTYGFEYFDMHYLNHEIGLDTMANGQFHYLAVYLTDNLTPYFSYGWSSNNKTNKVYREPIIGARYTYTESLTFLTEWKKSSWVQHDTFSDSKQYADSGRGSIELLAFQVIYSF